jgi:hypothetical protein
MLYLFLPIVLSTSISGDFEVQGTIRSSSLNVNSIKSDGSILVDSSLSATELSATQGFTDSLSTSLLTSPTGTITVNGNINLFPSPSASSFLQQSWLVAHAEALENSTLGWTGAVLKHCNGLAYLEGGCKNRRISRTFELPTHRMVRVVGLVHLLDWWQGEKVAVFIDGEKVWGRKGESFKDGINVCGNEEPDAAVSVRLDVVRQHSRQEIEIWVESELEEGECRASFGVSDLNVMARG